MRSSRAAATSTFVFDTAGVSLADIELGGSIAVSGVCLTATRFDASSFAADVSRETLSLTTLRDQVVGSRVNLEKALLAGRRWAGITSPATWTA